jgi:hypothetical protein
MISFEQRMRRKNFLSSETRVPQGNQGEAQELR